MVMLLLRIALAAYHGKVQILVPKVPGEMEIGGNSVENWCQIDEKLDNCLALAAISPNWKERTG